MENLQSQNWEHIQIEKEEKVYPYRFKAYIPSSRPPERNLKEHGAKLHHEIQSASEQILVDRRACGINADNLIILEVDSYRLSNNVLETLLNHFKVFLIEEISEKNGTVKLMLQFQDFNEIKKFDDERQLWMIQSEDRACLTKVQREELFSSIETIRALKPEDRIGKRLRSFLDKNLVKPPKFIVNIDIWFNNNKKEIFNIEKQIKDTLGTHSRLMGDLFEVSGLLLGRAELDEFALNALLKLDIVSLIELPLETIPRETSVAYVNRKIPVVDGELDKTSPLVGVLDSGISHVNPLIVPGTIRSEEDFDLQESSVADMNGHGTAVAGIVIYGNFEPSSGTSVKVLTPKVSVCSAKVMHNNSFGGTTMVSHKRPEQLIKEAIEFLHKKYGCRIFNLSIGNPDEIYQGGRQFAWASTLDDLSRSLDIVIVVSAGNVNNPELPTGCSRDEFVQNARDNLFSPEHRLINPATSALCVTVGSITRKSEPITKPGKISSVSVGRKDFPSVFTRVGFGVAGAIKPEFVDYGGNYALSQAIRGKNIWLKNDENLAEPSLSIKSNKVLEGFLGTSFAAPHVTHVAAQIEHSLKKQLGHHPSANLIRAFLANSAILSDEMKRHAHSSVDRWYTGMRNPKQDRLLRLYGYGRVTDSLLYSNNRTVTLFAEDALSLRDYHLYKIPVPRDFIAIKNKKSIKISLAYNPITQPCRKEYLADNLWVEVYRKIDEALLARYKAKMQENTLELGDYSALPNEYKAGFTPAGQTLRKSTLQQYTWSTEKAGGGRFLLDSLEDDPYIYVLVTGKESFKFSEMESSQMYAICVTFTYEAKEQIELYQLIKSKVRLALKAQIRQKLLV